MVIIGRGLGDPPPWIPDNVYHAYCSPFSRTWDLPSDVPPLIVGIITPLVFWPLYFNTVSGLCSHDYDMTCKHVS